MWAEEPFFYVSCIVEVGVGKFSSADPAGLLCLVLFSTSLYKVCTRVAEWQGLKASTRQALLQVAVFDAGAARCEGSLSACYLV